MLNLHPRRAYLVWASTFSASIEGFWVLSTIYAITDVGMSPFQLLMLGTALEATVLVSEIPTGVVADAISRKWSVVLSMFIIAAGFIVVGLSTTFWPILVSQIIWGVGWTFTSGAEKAWISDELLFRNEPQSAVDKALAAGARAWHIGGAVGLVAFGLIGYWLGVRTAIVLAGVWTMAVGAWMTVGWNEHGYTRVRKNPFANAIRILKNGWNLARADQLILTVLVITVLFHFSAEAVERLTDLRLINLGVPLSAEPVVFISGLAAITWIFGAVWLRWAEERIERPGEGRRLYIAMALVAAVGTALVALAPNLGPGVVGSLITRGIAWSVLPVVAEVWINRRAESESRATVQSFLGQAESSGAILGGLSLGLVARYFDVSLALIGAGLLFVASALYVWRSTSGRKLSTA